MDEYGSHASLYDSLVGPFLRSTHQDMVTLVQSQGCHSVLDLCCGTGLFAGRAAQSGLNVTGVDLSPAMLGVARSKYPSIQFHECDASDTPMADDSFDAATISFALHEKSRDIARAIISEAVRLVRLGGVIVIADYRRPVNRTSVFTGWGIRCVERMAGKEHHAHFQDYMQRGGSESFLAEAGLNAKRRTTHMSGWSGVFVHQVVA